MLTVATAAGVAAAPAGAWGAATEDPATTAADAEETVGGGPCWSRRPLWPSLTIWMMASASASSCRTAAWMLLAEPKLEDPGKQSSAGKSGCHKH